MTELEDRLRLSRTNYSGSKVNGRMEGEGVFTFPDGSRFEGEMKDGSFHGKGTIFFPNGGKYVATWARGIVKEGTYVFSDGLEYSETNWGYCCPPNDRRFHTEIVDQILPAGNSRQVNAGPAKAIPALCYDTGDGYYNPVNKNIYSYGGQLLRHADTTEIEWIRATCRVNSLFRPRRVPRERKIVPPHDPIPAPVHVAAGGVGDDDDGNDESSSFRALQLPRPSNASSTSSRPPPSPSAAGPRTMKRESSKALPITPSAASASTPTSSTGGAGARAGTVAAGPGVGTTGAGAGAGAGVTDEPPDSSIREFHFRLPDASGSGVAGQPARHARRYTPSQPLHVALRGRWNGANPAGITGELLLRPDNTGHVSVDEEIEELSFDPATGEGSISSERALPVKFSTESLPDGVTLVTYTITDVDDGNAQYCRMTAVSWVDETTFYFGQLVDDVGQWPSPTERSAELAQLYSVDNIKASAASFLMRKVTLE